ncbi:tetratricopeptide repeat protein [Longimicrobium sp.]|uniref:tetratricopeptide repeat protein n=1 Tax=Longimicrobium sp. TaxID=2029185 RepID=UPI002E37B45F|nr:tetratricopeptide repeat protein [Longimicrobium sp.]HEX6040919.1 tetratricopeptide repeat protein [Longimicrobium sp.]
MSRNEATVEQLLGLLPDVDELELLRLTIIGTAVPDPGKAWDSSSAYATVDKRIVSADEVDRAVRQAEESLREHIASLYEGLRPVFRSFFEGREDDAGRQLVVLGEQLEGRGRMKAARQCYRTALNLSLPLLDKGPQILALRRIGRVSLTLGDFHEAALHYERSAQLARDAGETRGEVVARTGYGNVLAWQGRWSEAERHYRDALALLEAEDGDRPSVERAQLLNNLGNIATWLQRLDEAEATLTQALSMSDSLGSAPDLAVGFVHLAHLRERQQRPDEARQAYERALGLPVPPSLQSGIATDLADLYLQSGHLTRAEEWSRVAEEHAIRAGSAYTLGRMYQGRGNIARARGDEDGFTFFEKALEIARDKGYPFLEAETLAEYAELRRHTGGTEEAEAYLERAREIFASLGAVQSVADADRVLEEIRVERTVVEVPPETPLAAAGD